MNVTLKPLGLDEKCLELPLTLAEVTIGRGADCDLQIRSPLVSRRHCQLVLRGDQVYVRDLGSSYGTAVNGEPISGEHLLRDGDRLWLAGTGFEVSIRHRRLAGVGSLLLSWNRAWVPGRVPSRGQVIDGTHPLG